jgi:hypothetical protein
MHIEQAKLAGASCMLLYYPCFFKGNGGYNFCGNYDECDLKDTYPEGYKSVSDMVKKIKDAGITPGIHFLQTHIGIASRYVVPTVDPRLNLTMHFTLAKPLSETDDTIYVLENPKNATMYPKCKVLNFGGEAISYEGYTTERPYCFYGCKRGHYGTNVITHKYGEIGGLLDVTEFGTTSIYLNQYTDLQDEIAEKIAKIYNTGFEFIYFDGSEGTNEPFDFYVPFAQYRVLRQLDREPLFTEGAAKAHFSWHFLSGGNAFDVFPANVFKEKIAEFPAEEAPRMRNDFTRLNFGWWGYFQDTQPDMYEYGTSRAAAWDSPVTVISNMDVYKSNPRTADNFEVLRRWEEARKTGFLTEAMKEELKKILFIKAMAALEAYQAAMSAKQSADETKIRHERFCAIWDVIETAGLEQEYETWKEG